MRETLTMLKQINLTIHLIANLRGILAWCSRKCGSVKSAVQSAVQVDGPVAGELGNFGNAGDHGSLSALRGKSILAQCAAAAACVVALAAGFTRTAVAASPEQDAEAALMPFFDVLASPPAGKARSFRIQGRVESLGPISFAKPQGASPDAGSAPDAAKSLPAFEFALQAPDRLRLSVPVGETTIVSCRNQQQIWAAPGAQVRPLLDALKLAGPRPGPKERAVLQPMQIPFSGKHLAVLPILLEVQSRGQMPLDGENSRVLDIRIQPEIARMLPANVKAWAMRLWLNAQGRPARVGLQGPDGNAVVRVEHIEFAPQLPDHLWEPPADAVTLTPAEFEDITHNLSKAVRK
jgi:hypothetical protein